MSVSANQVQQVIGLSVWGRRIATFYMALMLIGCGATLLGVSGVIDIAWAKNSFDKNFFPTVALVSWPLWIWAVLMVLIEVTLALAPIYVVRSVFASLARGEIFCAANVRRFRGLGILLIAVGLSEVLLPTVNAAILELNGFDEELYRDGSLSGLIKNCVYGGLMLLMSWIMAVGLGVREDAEGLRRDAELVI